SALSVAQQLPDPEAGMRRGDLPVAILVRIGNLALELRDYEEAEGYYKRLDAIPKSTDNWSRVLAWRHLGRIYILEDRYREAEEALNEADNLLGHAGARTLHFEDALVLAERAHLKVCQGKFQEATDLYQKVLPLLGTFQEETNGGKTYVDLEEAEVLSG